MNVVKMKTSLFVSIFFTIGILNVCTSEINKPSKITTTKQIADDTTTTNTAAASASASAPVETITLTNDATKDKRQTKDTKVASNDYNNHRSDTVATIVHRNSNTNSDDPEDPQETVYGTNARQFLIRPQQQHVQQHNEEEQLPPQLRNYPATIRPHNTQLLEQSQEIQHFAYLQDLNRNQPKAQNQGKAQTVQNKKSKSASDQAQNGQLEENEQRYAVAVEQPIPQLPRAHLYRAQYPYQLAIQRQLQQQQQQPLQPEQQNSNQRQYQIIPEEQFLKILEEELQARAYHEDEVRRQQAVQKQNQHHQQQYHQQQQQQQSSAAAAASQKVPLQAQGLGSYRQRLDAENDSQQDYIQYVQRPRGGPKYLPLQQQSSLQDEHAEQDLSQSPQPLSQLPPQITYYQPQISYKTLPNHPLAKSSLEKEIEMLFASNKPNVSPVQIVDNSNEPSLQHQRTPASSAPPAKPSARSPKAYLHSTVAPNSLIDGSNQPFAPNLYRFGNYPQPTPNYPVPVSQQVIDDKKLGPVIYPQQPLGPPGTSAQPPVQASQFYYQEAAPSPSPPPRPKAHRSKYGTKFPTTPSPLRTRQNEINYPVQNKYTQPIYDIERPSPSVASGSPTHFFPSPPDPHRNVPPKAQPTPAVTAKYTTLPNDFPQFPLPGSSPSQSSIYVSQGTGIATPSQPVNAVKPKTIEDLKQLHLPRPGGKPLTQAEFQALVDAGYPVTAVPVPVPVPYEQYIKDHPDYRNQPPPQPPALPVTYEHLMRFAQLQQHHQVPQYAPLRPTHSRGLIGRPSEQSVKIVSSDSEPQIATAVGGGSVTYLRAISENQKRRPRDEIETKVLGAKEKEKQELDEKQDEKKK